MTSGDDEEKDAGLLRRLAMTLREDNEIQEKRIDMARNSMYNIDCCRAANMESWLSGLRRTTGNRVWAYTPPRVQIPNSPPEQKPLQSDEFARVFCVFRILESFLIQKSKNFT